MRKLPMLTLALLLTASLPGCTEGEDAPTSASTTSTTSTTALPTMPPGFPQRPPPQWTPGPWIEGGCPFIPAAQPMPRRGPDLLAVDAGGALTRYAWREGGALEVRGRAVPGIRLAAPLGQTVVTAQQTGDDWQLVLRSPNLASIQNVTTPRVTAMDADGSRLYVVTPGNLTVYGETLQQLGSVALGAAGAGTGQGVLSIRVAQGYAYLMDNAAAPYFAYRVDVRDPAAMSVLLRHNATSSLSPKLQWLDVGNNTWYVEKNVQGEGLMGRAITPLQLGNGTAGQAVILHSSSFPVRAEDPRPQQDAGYTVHDSTFLLPAWALVDANHTLVRVQMRGPLVQRTCPAPAVGDIHVLERDGMVVTWGRTHVRLWEPGPQTIVRGDAGLHVPPIAMWLAPPS